ncbi:hypothetical protein BKA80DRAFT_284016 [Phyllosticta citrichinensis]
MVLVYSQRPEAQGLAGGFSQELPNVFLAAIGPWKSIQEQPKVAIYQQWLPAFLALSVHVTPLAAA